jgi:hypothetical protein
MGYYAASSGNFLPQLRDNLSVPYSEGLKMGLISCPETWVRNYHCSLRHNPEERISHLLLDESLKSRIVPFSSQIISALPFYRVSIKSFPDYKHLLQENYVEYKLIFLSLLKLVVKQFR